MANVTVSEVLQLPIQERLRIAEAIWDSIAETPENLAVSAADRAELDRRLESFEGDPSGNVPWSSVREKLRRKA